MRFSSAPSSLPMRLQTRIGLSLGVLILGVSIALALLLGRMAEDRLVRLGAQNLGALTDQMARELSAGMHQFAREVLNQTYRDRYRDPESTPAQLREALEEFQRANPEFSYVSIVDVASRRVVAANGGIFEGGLATGRPVFEQGQKGLFVGDVHDAVRLAELLPRPASGEPLRFLDFAAPIRDPQGRAFRVFGTHVGWEWAGQVRDHVLGPAAGRQGVELLLVDTQGKVVLAAGPQAVPAGTDLGALVRSLQPGRGAVRTAWPDGIDYLTASAPVQAYGQFPGFGWRVVTRQPYDRSLAPVRQLQMGFVGGGALIGLLAAALAWFLAGRLVRPLRRLADQIDRAEAAAGTGSGWQDTLPAEDETGEVLAVKRALARMADSARSSADASSTSARQFEALGHALDQVVVWQADASGQLGYVNQEWLLAGRDAADRSVAAIADLLHPEDAEAFHAAWRQSTADGTDLSCRMRLRRPGEAAFRWCDIRARAVPDTDGTVQRWVGTIFDIDEIVRLADATQRALEEEKAARAQSDRLARMRDEFLATVSHELRSPLNAITGWSEILARKRTDDPMIVKASEAIRRNARQQAGLIDDLMDMTAVMAGKMVLQTAPVDLAEVARSVYFSHLPAAQAKGVALACAPGGPVVVEGEARRLEQLLSNLVGNAVKFTPAGGRIDLSAEVDGAHAVLRVCDTGRGISATFLPHVFERLRQEDGSVTRSSGGLGLGLAIAQGVAELHGGRITAESEGPDQGACFTVRLPLAADGPDALPAGSARAAAPGGIGDVLQGLRVLLVDDEPDAREVAQVALASFGAEVRAVGSAAEALAILETHRFDRLVSDIGMPVMDGLTLIRTLRQRPGGSAGDLPAVALTAFSMATDVRAGLDAGFQGYVAKPIALQPLYDAIRLALQR
ncbi:ATP-binding protein [uncultured Xylophilus sp.]|uniref:ATP-binding protein n=1 Tax=uncultured Xylophilus sp. TaxID=296832 RepID=UPI0026002FB7|nr:ATP-binding protein [uncultured Xylophilus sp.]